MNTLKISIQLPVANVLLFLKDRYNVKFQPYKILKKNKVKEKEILQKWGKFEISKTKLELL